MRELVWPVYTDNVEVVNLDGSREKVIDLSLWKENSVCLTPLLSLVLICEPKGHACLLLCRNMTGPTKRKKSSYYKDLSKLPSFRMTVLLTMS